MSNSEIHNVINLVDYSAFPLAATVDIPKSPSKAAQYVRNILPSPLEFHDLGLDADGVYKSQITTRARIRALRAHCYNHDIEKHGYNLFYVESCGITILPTHLLEVDGEKDPYVCLPFLRRSTPIQETKRREVETQLPVEIARLLHTYAYTEPKPRHPHGIYREVILPRMLDELMGVLAGGTKPYLEINRTNLADLRKIFLKFQVPYGIAEAGAGFVRVEE